MFKEKRTWVVILVFVLFSGIFYFLFLREEEQVVVSSFDECVEAGYPVMESYPRQCSFDGKVFVEEVSEYYGSSTDFPCEVNDDCVMGGCNGEVCHGVDEGTMASICLYPEEPLPADLGYSCGCFEGKCQWGRD